EKDPGQPQLLHSLMRAAHSIKGAARIVGVDAAVQVAHVMEDCLVAAQRGELHLDADAIDALLKGLDVLGHGEEVDTAAVAAVVEPLAAVREGRKPAAQQKRAAGLLPAGTSPAARPESATLTVDNLDRAGSERLRQQLLEQ